MSARAVIRSLLILLAVTSPAGAVTWDAPIDVTTGATDLGDPARPPLAQFDGLWYLVTVESGNVVVRSSSGGPWSAPQPLTSGVTPFGPVVASSASALHVAWQDDRTGHAEIWTRRFDGSTWSPEECLTCDGVASTTVALAGDVTGRVLAAFVDAETVPRVRGALFEETWQAPLDLSDGTYPASAPSVSTGQAQGTPFPPAFTMAWVEAYSPSMRVIHLGGYLPASDELLLDEPVPVGAGESSVAVAGNGALIGNDGEVFWLSVLDGLTPEFTEIGQAPGAAEHAFTTYQPEFPSFTQRRFYSAWAEDAGGGLDRLVVRDVSTEMEVSTAALTPLFVSAWSGEYPDALAAEIMLVWVDDVSGTPTLRTQRGTDPSCSHFHVVGDDAFLITPAGHPATTARAVDECSGTPLLGSICTEFSMSATLVNELTWDPNDEGPPPFICYDPDGYVVVALRGGGCSQAGTVRIDGLIAFSKEWPGVKSPDVDGDCIVEMSDRDYVVAQLGTDDFCADLDGSGIVDAGDVAIVDATLGDECSAAVAVDDPTPALLAVVRAYPNPARRMSHVLVEIPGATSATVRIWDASGRLVRTLGSAALVDGRDVVAWDLTDRSGREVANGAYFVRVQSEEQVLTARVRVIR